jgi:hypothetical protein
MQCCRSLTTCLKYSFWSPITKPSTEKPFPLAVYSAPNIVIRPSHARTCSFEEIQSTICHELIHAWLHRKGLDGTGEFVDYCHNEWFLKKALEINKRKIDNLNVDVDFLLATPKAVDIYSRVAGIRFRPHLQHKLRKIRKAVAVNTRELLQMSGSSKNDPFWGMILISFSVVIIVSFLTKVHLIPEAVASFVWYGWVIAGLVLFVVIGIYHRTR